MLINHFCSCHTPCLFIGFASCNCMWALLHLRALVPTNVETKPTPMALVHGTSLNYSFPFITLVPLNPLALVPKRWQYTLGGRSFSAMPPPPKLCNTLPQHLRDVTTISSFRSRLGTCFHAIIFPTLHRFTTVNITPVLIFNPCIVFGSVRLVYYTLKTLTLIHDVQIHECVCVWVCGTRYQCIVKGSHRPEHHTRVKLY